MSDMSDVNIFKPFHPPITDVKTIIRWMDKSGVIVDSKDVIPFWREFSDEYDAHWLTPSENWLRKFARFVKMYIRKRD